MGTTGKPKASSSSSAGFSDAEKAAMRTRAKELKQEERMMRDRAAGETALLDAVKEMDKSSKAIGTKLHAIISAEAPHLMPKTWYGMPAYADANGKVLIFFRAADKFNERYLTLGFQDNAKLDDGIMWPTSYALTDLDAKAEASIRALVKRAAS